MLLEQFKYCPLAGVLQRREAAEFAAEVMNYICSKYPVADSGTAAAARNIRQHSLTGTPPRGKRICGCSLSFGGTLTA